MEWLKKINPSVHCAGQGSWKKDFVEPERQIYDHELVFFEKGVCELELASCKYKFNAGSWVIIPPGVSHTSRAVKDDVLRRWVHFDWVEGDDSATLPICQYAPAMPDAKLLRNAPAFVPDTLLRGTLKGKNTDVIYSLMDSLELRLQHSDDMEKLTGKAVFQEILLRLLAGTFSAENIIFPSVNTDAFKVKMLLDQMPDSTISIRALLASLGKSYEHLCRRFRDEYNLTPVEYLNKLRVETAKQLLTNNSLDISRIAEKCGYSSSGYFCRIFRKNSGLSPSEYRRKIK